MSDLKANRKTLQFYRVYVKKWSVTEAAKAIGVVFPTLYAWEAGQNAPSESSLKKIANAYDCEPIDLTQEITENDKEYSENQIKRIRERCEESDDSKDWRLALEIHKHFYPEPTKLEIEMTEKEKEKKNLSDRVRGSMYSEAAHSDEEESEDITEDDLTESSDNDDAYYGNDN